MPRWRNGRRARFRCECLAACRFESYPGHKAFSFVGKAFLFVDEPTSTMPIYIIAFVLCASP